MSMPGRRVWVDTECTDGTERGRSVGLGGIGVLPKRHED